MDINLRAARRELTQALAEIEMLRQQLSTSREELAEKQAMIDKLRKRVEYLEEVCKAAGISDILEGN